MSKPFVSITRFEVQVAGDLVTEEQLRLRAKEIHQYLHEMKRKTEENPNSQCGDYAVSVFVKFIIADKTEDIVIPLSHTEIKSDTGITTLTKSFMDYFFKGEDV